MRFRGDWPGCDEIVLRAYADGEDRPSIEMKLCPGYGFDFGEPAAPWGCEKMGETGQPIGFCNTFKVPFGRSIRVTAHRAKDLPDGAPFRWIIRDTENLSVTLGGVRRPETAQLKLRKLQNHIAKPLEEFALCDVLGASALYQVTIAGEGLRQSGDWKDICYLEAIMRAYLGGAKTPPLLSSGLEEYFLGTYYFNRGRCAKALAGLTHLDTKKNTLSAYRFHDDAPLFFQPGLRLTCRCGEELNGKMPNSPPNTRVTTYSWVYYW